LLREAVHLLDLGVADSATIDAAVSDGLAPRWVASGPLATADLGGLDTFGRAAAAILPTLDGSTATATSLSERAMDGPLFFGGPTTISSLLTARASALRLAAEVHAERPTPCPSDGTR
jgi:hypothetical protein